MFRHTAIALALATLLPFSPAYPADIEAVIEGTWSLTEWRTDQGVFVPPQAEGRFTLKDGVVLLSMHLDREDSSESVNGYGVYVISAGKWTYRYDHRLELKRKGAEDKITYQSTRGTERVFDFEESNGKVVLDNERGKRQFVFESGCFTYFDSGKPLRKWCKVAP